MQASEWYQTLSLAYWKGSWYERYYAYWELFNFEIYALKKGEASWLLGYIRTNQEVTLSEEELGRLDNLKIWYVQFLKDVGNNRGTFNYDFGFESVMTLLDSVRTQFQDYVYSYRLSLFMEGAMTTEEFEEKMSYFGFYNFYRTWFEALT